MKLLEYLVHKTVQLILFVGLIGSDREYCWEWCVRNDEGKISNHTHNFFPSNLPNEIKQKIEELC